MAAPADDFSAEQLIKIVDELLDGWRSGLESARLRIEDAQTAMAIIALAEHAHRLAPVARDLLSSGLVLESTALIRQCYEIGLTCQWLKHVPDSLISFVGEGLRQRRNAAVTLRKVDRQTEQGIAASIEAMLPTDMSRFSETPSRASGRNFNELCADLEPGGDQAYSLYKALSAYSHATSSLADLYLEADPDKPDAMPRFREDAQIASPRAWAYLLAVSLTFAGRAVDMADRDHPRRSQLRRAANQLGVPAELKLSGPAWLRLHPRKAQ